MAQIARFRQPGAAAIAFMNTLAPTEARLSARARSARRPFRDRAIPRQAKTRAAVSGIAASRTATTGRWRVASTIRYWAVKLTAAAAAASTHSPAAALRSHSPERSWPGPGHPVPETLPATGPCGADGPAGPVSTSRTLGITGWPTGFWPIGIGDAGRMISVTAAPFLRTGKTNGAEIASRGIPTRMAWRAGNLLDGRIGQSSGRSPARTPTPRTDRVRASRWPSGGAAVRWRGRSPAWTPTTRIANTAVTAPDKNAAMTSKTTVEAISGLRFRHLIGRSASRGNPFPGPGKSDDRDGRAQERGEPIIPCYRRCYGR